jgi:hypothetical protein
MPVFQSNEVCRTPCAAVSLVNFGSASHKRCYFSLLRRLPALFAGWRRNGFDSTVLLFLVLLLGACASTPESTKPQDVALERYSNLDCFQLAVYSASVQQRITALEQQIKDFDELTTGKFAVMAWYVLWPELIYQGIATVPEKKAEISGLVLEYNAIAALATSKGCVLSAPATTQGTSPPASSASSAQR